jgi:hypothetical protein
MIQSAAELLGGTPVFWGRYFTSINTTGSVEYRHSSENGPLAQAGIRVLPVARQTKNVNGTSDQGIADGVANAQDYITTFTPDLLVRQGGRFYVFLDVEGSPSLSQSYYRGWVQGLTQQAESQTGGGVTILPCVYATQSDVTTWKAVGAAISAGVPCSGAWIARYFTGNCAMGDWQSNIVTPSAPTPFPCPILAWQYAGNCMNGQIDCNQTNPAIDLENDLLRFLVMPPGAGAGAT